MRTAPRPADRRAAGTGRRAIRVARLAALLAIVPQATTPAWSQVTLDPNGRVRLSGDFRLRQESDWDSRTPEGNHRANRHRARLRLRLGVDWTPASWVSVRLRARSGSRVSQQSPHITFWDFSGNPTGDSDILLDRWLLQVKRRDASAWIGRNNPPFWKQNELFWDDDVTVRGVGANYRFGSDRSALTVNAGTVALPDGGVDFNGNMHTGQVVYAGAARGFGYTAALGVFRLEAGDRSRHLLQGNGARDYTLWTGNLQARAAIAGRPLIVGVDLIHNAEDYAGSEDAFTAANQDRKDGFVASALWGRTGERGSWQIGYSFARIETLAVNASFAQDDWVRWGSATQTDASDFKGHELRFVYVPLNRMDLVARLYLVEAITSAQDGRRFRLDWNYRF